MYVTPCVLYIYIYPIIPLHRISYRMPYRILLKLPYIETQTDKGLNMEHQGTSAEAQDLKISG